MTIRRWIPATIWISILTGLTLQTVSAQQPPAVAPPPEAAASLAGIRSDLSRLIDLVEQFRDYQKVDLLLKRIDLKQRRLEPLQSRLRSAEARAEGLEEELTHLTAMKEQADNTLQEEIQAGIDMPESDTRQITAEIETRLKIVSETIDDARLKVRYVEDEMAEQLDEIEQLDEALAELLGDD